MAESRKLVSRNSKRSSSTKKRRNKPLEFSKIILVSIGLFSVIVTIFTLVIIWRTGDTSPLSYLIPAVFAELATATGFYYNKAKAENRIKIAKSEGIEYVNQTGIDQL